MHIEILVQRLRVSHVAHERIEAVERPCRPVLVPGPQVLHGDALVELFAGVEEVGEGVGGVESEGVPVCDFGDPEEDKTEELPSHTAFMGPAATRTGLGVARSPVASREPDSASRALGRERRLWSAASWRR